MSTFDPVQLKLATYYALTYICVCVKKKLKVFYKQYIKDCKWNDDIYIV